MGPLAFRKTSLRKINIIYGVTLIVLSLVYTLSMNEYYYFDNAGASILIPLIVVMVYIVGYVLQKDGIYQLILYATLWSITIISTNVSYLYNHQKFSAIHIILLIMTVFAIYNKKTMKQFIMLYSVLVVPVVIYAGIDVEKQFISLTAIVTVLLIGQIKSQYDFELFSINQNLMESKYQILNNSFECYALHRMIYDVEGVPKNYTFLDVNLAFEQMIGMKREDIIGKNVLDVLPLTEKKWISFYGTVLSEKKQKKKIEYAKEFDSFFEVSAYPVEEDCFAVLFTDVTERLRKERELQYAISQYKKMDKLKIQFLKDVNHRLRTPLNGMMGMTQLIDLDDMSEDNRELFRSMVLEMRHFRNIINQVAKYVDIQVMEYVLERCNIEVLLKTCIIEVQDKDFAMTLNVDEYNQDDQTVIDTKMLKSVINEVIQNAIRHSKDQKIDITIKKSIRLEVKKEFYEINIRNYGIIIPSDHIEYVFNEFYHHDFINIYKENDRISLPMCKLMLKKCDGDINVKSDISNGTVFTISLPIINK